MWELCEPLWNDAETFLWFAIPSLIIWLWQLIHLMSISANDFGSPADKTLWVVILLVTGVFGAVAFHLWKIGAMPGRSFWRQAAEPVIHEARRQEEARRRALQRGREQLEENDGAV